MRRVNEDNVDVNRNFLLDGERWAGAPDGYAALDGLLNPPRPPGAISGFRAKALLQIARRGLPALKNAVAGGQYAFPRGLFYGGAGPVETHRLLRDALPQRIGAARRVVHLDLHTGLGDRGTYKLLIAHPPGAPELPDLQRIFGASEIQGWDRTGVSYDVRGALGPWCKARFPRTTYDVVVAEFGTEPILSVVEALHRENRAHQWGNPAEPRSIQAKERLRDVFAPPEPAWRDRVVAAGVRLGEQAIAGVFG